MIARLILCLTVGSLAACGLAAEKAEDPALKKQLEEIDARAAKIKDFTSDFRQDKFTAVLKKPLVSTGLVRVSGAIIRWDTRKPEPAVLYSDGREVRMYYPEQKLLEIYAIDARLGELASSPLPRLGALREHFAIERCDGKTFTPPEGRVVLPLQLVPKQESLAAHVKAVRVLLDVEAGHILELEIIDADGDRTHVTFSNVRMDTGVKSSELELKVPADTTVSRPLEGKGEG